MRTNYRKTIGVIFSLLALHWFSICLRGAEIPSDLLHAIHMQEAGGKLNPPAGDHGKAIGPFQIHRKYWIDARVAGCYSDCTKYNYSVVVVTSYLKRYGAKYPTDYETLARIHNGGPRGYLKRGTLVYWRGIQRYL